MPDLHIPPVKPSETRYFIESDVKDPRAWYQIMDFITSASAKFGYSSQCTAVNNGDTVFDAKFDKRNRRLIREKVYVVSESLDKNKDRTVSGTAVLVVFENCIFIRNLCLLNRSTRFRTSFLNDLRGIIRYFSNKPVVTCVHRRTVKLFKSLDLGLRVTSYADVRSLDSANYIWEMSRDSLILAGP